MVGGRAGRAVPVIVGVAQLANKDTARLVTPVSLAHEAVERAVASTPALLDELDAVFAPPASVYATRTLADELAERLGVTGPRVTAGFSGAGPLKLLAQACAAVLDGSARVALLAGAVAESSFKHARAQGIDLGPQAAPWSQGSSSGRPLARTDAQTRNFFVGAETGAGVSSPGEIFALIESSFAFAAGRSPDEQRRFVGELMAPFTAVAATRPEVAWFPVARRAEELSTVTIDNRMVAEPYPKRMNSFPTVDLAAAVFVTTDAIADELGVAHDQRVYPWSTGLCSDVAPPSGRPSLHSSRALHATIEATLRGARLGTGDLTLFDLYSCFPAAVQMSMDALGLRSGDPRGFTLTGGLPYFGGPGANYVTHAIVAAVERCLGAAHERALVVGLGGAASDFAATVFAATPPDRPWSIDRCGSLAAVLEAERVPADNTREGPAVVEAITVVHEREAGPTRVALIARYADGVRVGASSADPSRARALAGSSLVGRAVHITLRDGQPEFDAV